MTPFLTGRVLLNTVDFPILHLKSYVPSFEKVIEFVFRVSNPSSRSTGIGTDSSPELVSR